MKRLMSQLDIAPVENPKKKTEKVELADRNHPDSNALAASSDKAADVFTQEKTELRQSLVDQLKAQQPELKDNEINTFVDSMMEMADKPELMAYIMKLSKRLNDLFAKVNELRAKEGDRAALYAVVDFMDDELKRVDKGVKDEDSKSTIIASLNEVINFQQLEVEDKAQIKQDTKSALLDATPFVGDYKAVREGLKGETINGEKLGILHRSWKVVVGGVSFVAGVASLGETEAAEEVFTGGKAIVKGAEVGMLAKKGIDVATRLNKLTSRLSTMPKLTRLARTTSEVTTLMVKYPKLAGSLMIAKDGVHIAHGAHEVSKASAALDKGKQHLQVIGTAKAMAANNNAQRSDNDTAKAEKPAEDHGQLAA